MSPLQIRYLFFGERNKLQGTGRAARSKEVGGRGDVYLHLPAGVSNESVRAQLEKILSSQLFARCERLGRFLRFTIDRALRGEMGKVKEFQVGVEVFDREESFDPRIDSIVRVQAGRLRARLQKYYDTEGAEDPLVIQFRKGGYIPDFTLRKPPSQPEKDPHSEWKIIAVLPFADLSPGKDQEFFCDGMTEELINALSKAPGMRVVAPTSVFQFKGKAEDVRKIGRELEVDAVLGGSVRKADDRLRITANLVQVSTGYVLWSETYESELKDVFAIQDQISRAIVKALSIELKCEQAPLLKRSSENLEAYHLYLRGRYHARKLTEEGLTNAVRHLEEAIAMDLGYGQAWAALARAYGLTAFYAALEPGEFLKKAKKAALRALEIDDELAEAHAVLGLTGFVHDWNWQEAERMFKRATELNPGDATAHTLYALHLACLARLDESTVEVERAYELDPISLFINTNMGWILYLKHEYNRALEQYRKALELHPNSYLVYLGLGLTYEAQSMFDEAIAALEKSQSLSRGVLQVIGALGHCLAAAGRRERALELLRELKGLSKQRSGSEFQMALIHIGLGSKDPTLECLKRACKERDPWLVHLKVDPRFHGLKARSEFTALLRKVGLEAPVAAEAKARKSFFTSK